MFRKLQEKLIGEGWKISTNKEVLDREAIISALGRYDFIGGDYIEWLSMIESCFNEEEGCFFCCYRDYMGDSRFAFRWNEFELLSLEAAGDNNTWRGEIEKFWHSHLPIILSVSNGYSYYAIRNDGKIVVGYEPEFEATQVIADSFTEFCDLIVSGEYNIVH